MSDWEEIEFDEQCKEANDNYIQDLKAEYEQKIRILEKALDKACDYLEDGYGDEMASEYYFVDGKKHYLSESKEWKEYLLKESEKE